MENRDRAMQINLQDRGKQEIMDALSELLDTAPSGRIRFEKAGEAFSLWTEPEPICS